MTDNSNEREDAFDRIVHDYYQAIENGEEVNQQQFIDDHPDYQQELQSFFADLTHLGKVALPKTEGASATTSRKHSIAAGTSFTYIGEYCVLEEIARGWHGRGVQGQTGETTAYGRIENDPHRAVCQ